MFIKSFLSEGCGNFFDMTAGIALIGFSIWNGIKRIFSFIKNLSNSDKNIQNVASNILQREQSEELSDFFEGIPEYNKGYFTANELDTNHCEPYESNVDDLYNKFKESSNYFEIALRNDDETELKKELKHFNGCFEKNKNTLDPGVYYIPHSNNKKIFKRAIVFVDVNRNAQLFIRPKISDHKKKVHAQGTEKKIKWAINEQGDMFAIGTMRDPKFFLPTVNIETEIKKIKDASTYCSLATVFFENKNNQHCIYKWEKQQDLYELIFKKIRFDKVAALRNILQGVSLLHKNGIVHGDIKLENILMDDHAKISDFGFAQKQTSDRDPFCKGTIAYLSPELNRMRQGQGMTEGEKREATSYCSDMYALGILSMYLFGIKTVQFRKMGSENTLEYLLQRLLNVDPKKRATIDEAIEIFGAIDWNQAVV